jgi:dipeptidyl-peptidase-4
LVATLADGQLLSMALWAPKGSALVYVLDNDIYYHQLTGESVETRRLTFDGRAQAVYNGVPDWVYEGQIFHHYSLDSGRVCAIRLNRLLNCLDFHLKSLISLKDY